MVKDLSKLSDQVDKNVKDFQQDLVKLSKKYGVVLVPEYPQPPILKIYPMPKPKDEK